MTSTENVHVHEIHKFGSKAERWWDPQGEFKTLHQINPLRLQFILQHAQLHERKVVDVGCGGGILTEALANAGADALGIDLSEELVDVAELHGLESGSRAHYQKISSESLAAQCPEQFDHVTCMELLEHVPDPAAIVAACATLAKTDGLVFFSTLNRVPKAYLLAIVGAEHLLNLVPKGTHDYSAFIKPAELSRFARRSGLELVDMTGIEFNPLSREFYLSKNIDVNYLAAFKKS